MKHSENQIKTAMEHLSLAACRADNFVVMKEGMICENTVR